MNYIFVAVDPRTHTHFTDSPINKTSVIDIDLLDQLRSSTVVARRITQFILNTVGNKFTSSRLLFQSTVTVVRC
jgi:hypothetical protein